MAEEVKSTVKETVKKETTKKVTKPEVKEEKKVEEAPKAPKPEKTVKETKKVVEEPKKSDTDGDLNPSLMFVNIARTKLDSLKDICLGMLLGAILTTGTMCVAILKRHN